MHVLLALLELKKCMHVSIYSRRTDTLTPQSLKGKRVWTLRPNFVMAASISAVLIKSIVLMIESGGECLAQHVPIIRQSMLINNYL